MQIRVRHLLQLTIVVAILFGLASWGPVGWTIIGVTLFAIHFVVLVMPVVIFVLAIVTSEQVGTHAMQYCDQFLLHRRHEHRVLAQRLREHRGREPPQPSAADRGCIRDMDPLGRSDHI